jgi:hypothetical protein
MELPEPFHSAEMSSWPSLMADPKVPEWAKFHAREFLRREQEQEEARNEGLVRYLKASNVKS